MWLFNKKKDSAAKSAEKTKEGKKLKNNYFPSFFGNPEELAATIVSLLPSASEKNASTLTASKLSTGQPPSLEAYEVFRKEILKAIQKHKSKISNMAAACMLSTSLEKEDSMHLLELDLSAPWKDSYVTIVRAKSGDFQNTLYSSIDVKLYKDEILIGSYISKQSPAQNSDTAWALDSSPLLRLKYKELAAISELIEEVLPKAITSALEKLHYQSCP